MSLPLLALASLSSSGPTATVAGGVLNGLWEGDVATFIGVPYAKSPEGALRWKEPEPAVPFLALNATKFGSECLQWFPSFTTESLIGSEDCLFLNVYAPRSALPGPGGEPAAGGNRPVMVWIHGGGYEAGAGSWYNASELTAQLAGEVITVTINYRLSVLGFLGGDELRARAPDNSTGNYGLQDQRAAMRWVQANAAAFGGDPSRVTIFGESAGASSVSCHLCAARSRGLFARAGMESSSFATGAATLMADANRVYGQVLGAAKCADLECLVGMAPASLFAAKARLPECCDFLYPFLPWAPVVDGVELRQHPFECVAATAREGEPADGVDTVAAVPILHGTNLDEGSMFDNAPPHEDSAALAARWAEAYGAQAGAGVAAKLAKLYPGPMLGAGPNFSTSYVSDERSYGDFGLGCPARRASKYLAKRSVGAPFQYHFVRLQLQPRVASSVSRSTL